MSTWQRGRWQSLTGNAPLKRSFFIAGSISAVGKELRSGEADVARSPKKEKKLYMNLNEGTDHFIFDK